MPHSRNPAFPRTRRKNPYDGVGGWAPNSSRPPWGWPITLIIALALLGVLFYGPMLAARSMASQHELHESGESHEHSNNGFR